MQLYRDNLGEQKVLKNEFFRLPESLKPKILATKVLRPRYTGFITRLPFWATWRLERMNLCRNTANIKTFSLQNNDENNDEIPRTHPDREKDERKNRRAEGRTDPIL